MTAEKAEFCGLQREAYIANGGRKGAKNDPVHVHGVKRRSALNDLSYWTKLFIRHVLDPMHCKKNLTENLLKTIWGMKDFIGSRQDMESHQIRSHLWVEPTVNGRSDFHLPKPPCVLDAAEKLSVMHIIKSLKTPSNYVGVIQKGLEEGKLRYMKSHDFHVFMHHVLLLALRNALSEKVRQAIMKASRVFQRLCKREILIAERDANMVDAADALCLLKKAFPPTFMDIMSHLMIHLVQELYICGPIHCRWMYPIERYMKTLKEYVRTYARPEASIAEGYAMSETLGYCTEYLQCFEGTSRPVWDDKEEQRMNDEVLQGSGWARPMSHQFLLWVHNFVVVNSVDMEPWREKYREKYSMRVTKRLRWAQNYVQEQGKNTVVRYPEEYCSLPDFPEWLQAEVELASTGRNKPSVDVIEASKFPEEVATSYRAMYAHGMHLRVRSAELEKTTCDSAIAASVMLWKSGRGVHQQETWESSEFVGWIEEILELDYQSHYCVILVCAWVPAKFNSGNANVIQDKYGFTLANFATLNPLGATSFAFPTQC